MNKDRRLVIIGAGGHGKVIADIALKCGYEKIVFLDDSPEAFGEGPVSDYIKYKGRSDYFVGIGSNAVRERIQALLTEDDCEPVTLVHPSAVIGSRVKLGNGSAVMAGAVINADAVIGNGVIINTASSVDHDCVVGDYSHVSVGAHVAGTVTIGCRVMIGAGATVINNLSLCDNCMIGAGAVVINDIVESGTYIGVPAQRK